MDDRTGMNGTKNRGSLNDVEKDQQVNQINEPMPGYASTQMSRSNMKDKPKRGKKRLSALVDESGMDDIAPYGTSPSSTKFNPNPADIARQQEGRFKDAEKIEEIDPYGTSSITTRKDNRQEEKGIKVMNDGNESKPVTGEPATEDMYATVDKNEKNKLEEQAVNDMYATVDKKEKNSLEVQATSDNCNLLNNTYQEYGKIRDAEHIKEIDPYGTSSINVPNPAIRDIYATVDKTRKNKLEEQATSDMYAAVNKKGEIKLEAQANTDPMEYDAGVNKQKKEKEITDNNANNKDEEMHQLYAEVDASAVSNPKPADDANQEDGKNKDADEVQEIDPYGTSCITNPNPVNDTIQEDGELIHAAEIEEIVPYAVVNKQKQKEKAFEQINEDEEMQQLYAEVEKINKREKGVIINHKQEEGNGDNW